MIVTFYSYKGGVGRSMAMSNVAYILARQGLKTLIVDFDLEAPGLEQYFQTNHAAARRNPGLVDLLTAYKRSMSVTGPSSGDDAEFKQIDRFIVPMYETLPGGGRLDLLPAGRRESREELDRYASTLRSFDWQDFYFNWEGELFFEWLRGLFVPDRYDVVLVDSRTGVTEMGGICTYQLADAVVMLCAANRQNIRGTRNIITDFLSPSVRATRQFRPLQILVVPARIEQRDPALYDDFIARFDTEFRDVLPDVLRDQIGYRDLTVPYEPSYAFDERVITDPSATAQQRTIAGAFVRLARAIALLAPPESALRRAGAPDRAQVQQAATPEGSMRGASLSEIEGDEATGRVAAPPLLPQAPMSDVPGAAPVQYDVATRFAGYDVFLAFSYTDSDTVGALVYELRRLGLELFIDRHELASGEDWRARTEQALFHSRICVIAYGREGFGAIQTSALLAAVSSVRSAHQLPIVMLSLPGADDHHSWRGMPRELAANAEWVDMRSWSPESDPRELDRLVEKWKTMRAAAEGRVDTSPDLPEPAAVTPNHADIPPISSIGAGPGTAYTSTTASYEAPYPGARPFTERDAGFLFSRETETVQVADALERHPLVVVTGPSGCGKTSLVLAAVVPALRQRQAERGGPGWLFERTTPERAPLADLDRAIERLRKASAASSSELRSILFVDELEDLLLSASDEDRRRYLEKLAELVTQAGGRDRITLLIALREDRLSFFQAPAAPAAFSLTGPHVIALPRLTADGISEAIERTAQRAGLAFEPGLVRRLVTDWGQDQRFLPFLQTVLYALWARRREGYLTNRAYDDIADPVDALAESTYADLSPAQQPLAARIIARLLSLCGDLATYDTSCTRADLLPRDMPPRDFEVVVERLIEGHLIYAFTGADGQARLAPAFASEQWTRAEKWLEGDRAFLEWLVRLDRYRQDWERGGRDTDALMSGNVRSEAGGWAARRAADLTAAEHEFIRLSDEEAALRRKVRWLYAAVVVAFILWGGWTWYRGEQEKRVVAEQAAAARTRSAAIEQFTVSGDAAAASGDWKAALTNYSQAIDLAPDNVSLRLKRGNIRDQQRDYKGAIQDFVTAIDAFKKNPTDDKTPLFQAHLACGTAWFHEGDNQRALTNLSAAIAIDPKNPLPLFNRAVVQEAMRNDKEALADYTAALTADPNFADALFSRGVLLERLSRLDNSPADSLKNAARDFNKLLTIKNVAPQTQQAARTRLGGLGYTVGAVERGPTLVQVLYANPKDVDVAQRVAAALREKGYTVDGIYDNPPAPGSDVRYFFLEDENVATAVQQVAQNALAAAGYNVQLPTQYVRVAPGMQKVVPGRIEIWIPALELRLLPNKAYQATIGTRSQEP